MAKKKSAVIIGAGPAGLTAAYELLEKTDIQPVVLEATSSIGGISQTAHYKGNRIDIGGHRFFSKSQQVVDFWTKIMPIQGSPSKDDILLQREIPLEEKGPNPESEDRVMLYRNRVSRIFFLRKFFDYPISLKWNTFANMGLGKTMKAGFGFMMSRINKRKEDSLENFYINRFGKPLYQMFFEAYTEKVWGIHPSHLGADWGSQRVKGLSITAIIKDMFVKRFSKKDNHNVETSLIEQFIYPKFGPGQLWEAVADEVQKKGGCLQMENQVEQIHIEGNKVTSVDYNKEGQLINVPCDYLLSSMPLKDLIEALRGIDVPADVQRIASQLPYRDFITVGLLVKELTIKNKTKIKTYNNRVPDTWIYIQERDVNVGRMQLFNNWSPYMVKDYEHTEWIGLEYFCNEGDQMWSMDKELFINKAIDELVKIDILKREDVIDSVQIKIKKAYPSYYGTYYELDKVKEFLNSIENLYCVGRNGQHRYNNMDHSMMTAFEAVNIIQTNSTDKTALWNVNADEEYHESKNSTKQGDEN